MERVGVEFKDFVAQFGGEFKVQLSRRLIHLLLQTPYQLKPAELILIESDDPACRLLTAHICFYAFAYRFFDCLWRYIMLFVELHLDFASAFGLLNRSAH